jgi:uncharacterized phiE125 gp8 family phage protein
VPERLVSPPDDDLLTLEMAKLHLVLETSDDDVLLEQIVAAATKHAEAFCGRGFVIQGWEALFPAFPVADPCKDTYFELSKGNISDPDEVEVKYVDSEGVEQTLDPTGYLVDDASVPGRVRLAPDASWPSTQKRWDAVRITYEVGWEPAAVPEPIKQAVLLLISQMYEQRTPEVTGTIVSPIKFSFEALLSPFRIIHL